MISATLLSQLPRNIQRLVRGVSSRSVADFQQLCERLADCSESELCILQPVFYMHLDPDCIPAKSTSAATTDIELARWSLLAIVTTLNDIDGPGADDSKKQYLLSAWNRVAPWLVFFHDQFIMCRANYRPVDRTPAIKLVTSILFHVLVVGRGPSGNTALATSPTLYRPIAELWSLALETKEEGVVCISLESGGRTTSLRVLSSFLAAECTQNEHFVTILLEVSGGIGSVTSAALKYVRSIRSMPKDALLVPMLWGCVRFIAKTSIQSAAMREAYILRQSVKEIFSVLRFLQRLLPGRGTIEAALTSSFGYLVFLLDRADDPVSALHQALRAHALETVVHIGPSEPLDVEVDFHKINADFFGILYQYLVHDKS
ncbi:hypothetical protein EDB19DRAFT_154345 [Suillus lakei]|nr:hypothetical protein EDB19DRAFT_154345 [Suillus lakei]